ncbi:hypothetical protein E2C01_097675 [Portunus trituberculatus]|uniref:Uncharacterized protein n=1 Tax=Portunus trituberculatus TaxID=210409 RepID=A0A5B7K5G4_PORTR|nr:hypothetical protein [Portunus trituberculatus]
MTQLEKIYSFHTTASNTTTTTTSTTTHLQRLLGFLPPAVVHHLGVVAVAVTHFKGHVVCLVGVVGRSVSYCRVIHLLGEEETKRHLLRHTCNDITTTTTTTNTLLIFCCPWPASPFT